MKKQNNLLWLFLIFGIIIVAGVFVFANAGNASVQTIKEKTSSVSVNADEVQIVKLSVQGSNYILSPSELKKGIPVRMEADMSSLQGCSRSIVIPAFNIRKTLSSQDNIIEFTPDKSGTFTIACSMYMYTGKFNVLESDGSKSAYVEQSSPVKASCGSGGCGCGGY